MDGWVPGQALLVRKGWAGSGVGQLAQAGGGTPMAGRRSQPAWSHRDNQQPHKSARSAHAWNGASTRSLRDRQAAWSLMSNQPQVQRSPT